MDTGSYATDFDKLALAVEATKVAKRHTVEEEGIGQDININLFSWRDDKLVSIMQLMGTHKMHRTERLQRIARAACIKRQGWGVDSFTFIAEGYCSLKPSETKDKDLAQLFAQRDSPVSECLSFTHLGGETPIFISVPYTIGVGRSVEFGKALCYSALDVMRDLTYAAALNASLKIDRDEEEMENRDKETYFGTLAEIIYESGFEMFYRDDV
jgi:hypothetical protein